MFILSLSSHCSDGRALDSELSEREHGRRSKRFESGRRSKRLESSRRSKRLESGRRSKRLEFGRRSKRLESGRRSKRLESGRRSSGLRIHVQNNKEAAGSVSPLVIFSIGKRHRLGILNNHVHA